MPRSTTRRTQAKSQPSAKTKDDHLIKIRGARQHNLKDVSLDLPRNQMIVFTGVSGSGKSSLAFDTIFAEGQRRYVESLSAYARQFLGQVDKPDVDAIEGLSPAISIDQKSTSHNPRSTVGTVTEIYDYLRLLYGRAGEPHCPKCDRSISPQSIDEMIDRVMQLPAKTKFQLLAPVVRGKKGTHQKLLSGLASEGFVRVRINGEVRELGDAIELKKTHKHDIEIVVDRLVMKPGIEERLTDSLSTCLQHADGLAMVEVLPADKQGDSELIVFSEKFACPEHGAVMEELSPRLFSFNSPYGACPECHGLGNLKCFSEVLLVPDPSLPLYAAIAPWSEKDNTYYFSLLYSVGQAYGFEIQTRWQDLTVEQQQIVMHGTKDKIPMQIDSRYRETRSYMKRYEGVIPTLDRHYHETSSDQYKQKLEKYLIERPCETCGGQRLKPEALAVRMGQYRLYDLTESSIQDCLDRVEDMTLSPRQAQIAELVLKEIKARLKFLLDVGLDYLTLDRPAMTLSGGEAQRIRLATQIGAGLTGVLYVLDEPSIGLHQRDNHRLLQTLIKLRDLGNTLIVVEHDEDTIRAADHLVDIGPRAGIHGGSIVAEGSLQKLLKSKDSLTGAYLSKRSIIETPEERRQGNNRHLRLKDASRNNLKHIDVEIPLGML
ncbi:MAG: excinuclease ABC subunit UvrA, partial [Cyanobacteria bacterium P01_F01_bin.42]